MSWTLASILLAVSVGLIGFSYQLSSIPLPLAVASILLYLGWILLDWRLTHYVHNLLDRLEKIEGDLGIEVHLHIIRTDTLRKPGLREIVYPPFWFVVAFWVGALLPNMILPTYVIATLLYLISVLYLHSLRYANLNERQAKLPPLQGVCGFGG